MCPTARTHPYKYIFSLSNTLFQYASCLKINTRNVGPRLLKADNHSLKFYQSGFLLLQYDDSDDEPAVLSLPDMSPVENILLDEELLLDQIKDLRSQDKATDSEGAVLVKK